METLRRMERFEYSDRCAVYVNKYLGGARKEISDQEFFNLVISSPNIILIDLS